MRGNNTLVPSRGGLSLAITSDNACIIGTVGRQLLFFSTIFTGKV